MPGQTTNERVCTDHCTGFLQHNIHLYTVFVPKMVELYRCIIPARLSLKLLEGKRLQKLTQRGAILD
jgi:hypothetical protein